MRVWTWLRRKACRHLNSEIVLNIDGPAPGWQWRCWSCGWTRGLEK